MSKKSREYILQSCRFCYVTCRRAGQREGEIQINYGRARRHLLRAYRLLKKRNKRDQTHKNLKLICRPTRSYCCFQLKFRTFSVSSSSSTLTSYRVVVVFFFLLDQRKERKIKNLLFSCPVQFELILSSFSLATVSLSLYTLYIFSSLKKPSSCLSSDF